MEMLKTCIRCGKTKDIMFFEPYVIANGNSKPYDVCCVCAADYGIVNICRKYEKESPAFLGCYVAENVLSKVFKDVKSMPFNNPGYDFVCNHGKKIDVKSGCTVKRTLQSWQKKGAPTWKFTINKNTVADYFLCLAFDDREKLTPLYMWLIPGNEINHLTAVTISMETLPKWEKYELSIDKVVKCCDHMR